MSLTQTSEDQGLEFDISAYCDDLGEQFEEEIRALGVNPSEPTGAKPGSEEKVTMLAARYAAGLPLWHNDDCYDHGPGSIGSLLFDGLAAAAKEQPVAAKA
ncbi:MAG: hypothetical protein AB8G99_07580 [Planctomycetaceae bacterium]